MLKIEQLGESRHLFADEIEIGVESLRNVVRIHRRLESFDAALGSLN